MKDEPITLFEYLSSAKASAKKRILKAIRHGLVRVDGITIEDPFAVIDPSSRIEFEGGEVPYLFHFVLMLNKPTGYMSSSIDEKYPSLLRLLPSELADRSILAGRLDHDTEGLILLSDSGRLTNRLVMPKFGVEKEYAATLDKPLTDEDFIDITERGTDFNGVLLRPISLKVGPNRTDIRIVLKEGRYHEIKRIFYRRGYVVVSLKRIRFAFLELGNLVTGSWRFLDQEEESKLRKAVGLDNGHKIPPNDLSGAK